MDIFLKEEKEGKLKDNVVKASLGKRTGGGKDEK